MLTGFKVSEPVKNWWRRAAIHTLKGAAASLTGAIGAAGTLGGLNWGDIMAVTGYGALTAFLFCIGGIKEVEDGASLGAIVDANRDSKGQE